jgi:hypothetical protein
MDLWASMGHKPRILGSSGAMEDALLRALWANVGCPSNGATPTGTILYQGDQAVSASQGQPKVSAPSKKSAQPDSKKRKVAEVASGSQPKAGSAKAVSVPTKVGKLSPQEQAVQLPAAKRTESFARLTRKAHLYQSAMDRFCRSLVYHNRRFDESIQEGEMVDLIDKSEEAELHNSLKKKKKNRDRLSKRKAKSLANKVSKLAVEPEEIQVQTPARELPSSAVVSSTPESLDMDVEMTPAVALPVEDLREGQIYHLVDGKLVVYKQAHLSTVQPSSSPPPEAHKTSEQPISYAEVTGKKYWQLDQSPQGWRKNWPSCQHLPVRHHRPEAHLDLLDPGAIWQLACQRQSQDSSWIHPRPLQRRNGSGRG